MNTTYVQKNSTVQKIADFKAASIIDTSSQSESLQHKVDIANNAAQRAEVPRPNNTGMPDNLKSGIESLSGFSMDDVRVHYNSSKPATVQALAYTQGTDIHVAPGQEKHLPHEAWHVAQQMAGRVSPTTNINGMPVNDNAALEHEADVMGEKAVQCKRTKAKFSNCSITSNILQCKYYIKYKKNEKDVYEFHNQSESEPDLKWYEYADEKKRHFLRKYKVYRIKEGVEEGHRNKVNPYVCDIASVEKIQNLNDEYNSFSGEICYEEALKFIEEIKRKISDKSPDVVEKFFSKENIEKIIGKFFSVSTGANLRDALFWYWKMDKKNKEEIFKSVKERICETVEDIVHWIPHTENNITKIMLTDSDVHTRGVGVCIVEYQANGVPQKCVIKPEKKRPRKSYLWKQ